MSQSVYIYFYVLSAIIIFSAFNVATRKNLVHAALFLCLTFIGVAGIFLLLNAEFLAAVQILIYAGAVTILILFAIMFTRNLTGKEVKAFNRQVPLTAIVTLMLAITMISILLRPVTMEDGHVVYPGEKWNVQAGIEKMSVDVPNIVVIGKSMMSTYTLAFWIISLILTMAMIGSLILARKN